MLYQREEALKGYFYKPALEDNYSHGMGDTNSCFPFLITARSE